MARGLKVKAPDERLRELAVEQDGTARERTALEGAVAELKRVLAGVPDRRIRAQTDELRGRAPEEKLEQIQVDEHQAAGEIATKRTRIEAAQQAGSSSITGDDHTALSTTSRPELASTS